MKNLHLLCFVILAAAMPWKMLAQATQASDPLMANTFEFIRELGLEFDPTNRVAGEWTLPQSLDIDMPRLGISSLETDSEEWIVVLTNEIGVVVGTSQLNKYSSRNEALSCLAFRFGGSSLPPTMDTSTIAVLTNGIGIICFHDQSTNSPQQSRRNWLLFENMAFESRGLSEAEAELLFPAILRAGGIAIPTGQEPLTNQPNLGP